MFPKGWLTATVAVAIVILGAIALGRLGTDQHQRAAAAVVETPTENVGAEVRAQQLAAQAAVWTAAISGVGLVVSVAGLIAVYWSLRQTRKAIRDNREIGEAQTRAYLSIVNFRAPQSGPSALRYAIANQGTTPAREVVGEHGIWLPAPGGELAPVFMTKTDRRSFASDVGSNPEEVAVPNASQAGRDFRSIIQAVQRERPARLVVRCRYRDVFGLCHEYVYVCDFYRETSDTNDDELTYRRIYSRETTIDESQYFAGDPVAIPQWAPREQETH